MEPRFELIDLILSHPRPVCWLTWLPSSPLLLKIFSKNRSQPASLQRTANPIPKSNYQKRLEREDLGLEVDSDEELSDLDDDFDQEDSTTQGQTTTATTSPSTSIPNENKISRKSRQKQREEAEKREYGYWSNYNRSFFHPNSILTIGGQLLAPMIGSSSSSSYTNEQGLSLDEVEDGRNRFESWEFGVRMFDETEKVSSFQTDARSLTDFIQAIPFLSLILIFCFSWC